MQDLPSTYSIKVPFTSQAPLFVWDATHEDACEEASLLMYYYWTKNKEFESSADADAQILKLINYEKKLGYGGSITLSELRDIALSQLSLSDGKIITLNNYKQIKDIIATGHPVIVGAAGKILPNPNFRNGGPNYHMLVIIGYDENGFTTNDPGTRNGKNFYYKNDELFDAIHDWNEQNILEGAKNALYFSK